MPLQNKNHISIPFQANIWKILINIRNFLLVLELRDEDQRQVSFATVKMNDFTILWRKNVLPEKWWLGVTESYNNQILLHGYKDHKTPVHLKSYVINVLNGELEWKNETAKPIGFARDGNIIVEEDGADEFSILNNDNGKIIGSIDRDSFIKNPPYEGLKLPNYYSLENKYFERISTFIYNLTELQASIAIEYLECNAKIIISFYVKKAEKLVNYILVSDEEGVIVSLEEVGTELNAASPDTFFVLDSKLVYIKYKKDLVLLEL